jgi:16S rRNA (guanine966-N2)-methyltransferase
MRVIAGTYRSRTLEAPAGMATRPSSDRLRETLFNVLAPRIEGAAFLDLYAGSGAVGIEALSRGAVRVDFVEEASAALKALHANLAKLQIHRGYHVHSGSVGAEMRRLRPRLQRDKTAEEAAGERPKLTPVRGVRFDLIFLDPPYDAAEEYASTLELLGGALGGLLAAGGLVVAEHRRKERLEDRYGSLQRTRLLEQGDASLSFYARAGAPGAEASDSTRSSAKE